MTTVLFQSSNKVMVMKSMTRKMLRFKNLKFGLFLLLLGVVFASCEGKKNSDSDSDDSSKPEDKPEAPATPQFTLTSSAVASGGALPLKYACSRATDGTGCRTDGVAGASNTTPPLSWTNAPAGTTHFILILFDKDSPATMHWYVAMPKDLKSLPEGLDVKTTPEVTLTTGQKIRIDAERNSNPYYHGPYPPTGKAHNYEFRLYAIKTTEDVVAAFFGSGVIAVASGNYQTEIEKYITGKGRGFLEAKILGTAVLPFTFKRP